jgi:hypothetical protein
MPAWAARTAMQDGGTVRRASGQLLRALGISVSLRARSGGDGLLEVDQPAWRNRLTIGQEFAGVVEDDDAVAQQAPPLLGVEGDGAGRVTVRTVG